MLTLGKYIAYIYDSHWYVGAITDRDSENSDIHVNTLHPHGPSQSFRFPSRLDEVWVPIDHVIDLVSPQTTSHGQYKLPEDVQTQIENRVKKN